jgi:L-aspartate oxidase
VSVRPTPPIVVVGAGVAGLSAALALAPRPVLLVCERPPGEGGATPLAAGGLAAALAAGDSVADHAEDTLLAGHGNDREAVRVLVAGAADAVAWLEAQGVRFDRAADRRYAFGRDGGHRRARILHAGGDATGAAIARSLAAAARATPSIRVLDGLRVDGVRLGTDGRVCGVLALDAAGVRHALDGAAVLLACGGIAGLFADRTGPAGLQGLGLSVAQAVGARLRDLPFVQFHPTALALEARASDGRRSLITEALRGAGAVLRDRRGQRLMAAHPLGDLAPRDQVARAVAAADGPWLDTSPCAPDWPAAFPSTVAAIARHGLAIGDPLPVCAAQHFHMGGVASDLDGATSVPGLFAVGECAANGAHGANRLASNSLLEGVVYGRRAAAALAAATSRPRPSATRRFAPGAEPEALATLRLRLSAALGPLRRRSELLRLLPTLAADTRQHAIARALVIATLAQRGNLGAHQWHAADAPAAPPISLWPGSPAAHHGQRPGSGRSVRP